MSATRSVAEKLLRIAGRHADRRRWERLAERAERLGVSTEAAEAAWAAGMDARATRAPCSCPDCEPEPEEEGGSHER